MIENNFFHNDERLVTVEHAMFTLDDQKVTSHYDRQTE